MIATETGMPEGRRPSGATTRATTLADDRLIVALDLPDASEGAALAARLGDAVSFYKIGLGMLATGGLDLAAGLKAQGRRIFLDLKLFDIGATVERAVRGIAGQAEAPDFLTVQGDPQVVRAAVEGRGAGPTRILAVTVLTSLDRADLDHAMIREGTLPAIVLERARRAFAAGADGVIAAPSEAAAIRALPESAGRLIVTPGIRPAGAAANDQKRVATPAAALAAGADHIVVGRPVCAAPDPAAAAHQILREIAGA